MGFLIYKDRFLKKNNIKNLYKIGIKVKKVIKVN